MDESGVCKAKERKEPGIGVKKYQTKYNKTRMKEIHHQKRKE